MSALKRLEVAGVIIGYRAVVNPAAIGRALEVLIDVEIHAYDRETVEEVESSVASYDEVIEFRRMFGRPYYFIRVAVADPDAHETFLTARLIGLLSVLRVESHMTLKPIKVVY